METEAAILGMTRQWSQWDKQIGFQCLWRMFVSGSPVTGARLSRLGRTAMFTRTGSLEDLLPKKASNNSIHLGETHMVMRNEQITLSCVSLKHRLESEPALLRDTPRGTALLLHQFDDHILVARADRNTLQMMPAPADFVQQACEMLDDTLAFERSSGFRQTLLVVFDSVMDMTALAAVTWDASAKIAMCVFADDEVFVVDERC